MEVAQRSLNAISELSLSPTPAVPDGVGQEQRRTERSATNTLSAAGHPQGRVTPSGTCPAIKNSCWRRGCCGSCLAPAAGTHRASAGTVKRPRVRNLASPGQSRCTAATPQPPSRGTRSGSALRADRPKGRSRSNTDRRSEMGNLLRGSAHLPRPPGSQGAQGWAGPGGGWGGGAAVEGGGGAGPCPRRERWGRAEGAVRECPAPPRVHGSAVWMQRRAEPGHRHQPHCACPALPRWDADTSCCASPEPFRPTQLTQADWGTSQMENPISLL